MVTNSIDISVSTVPNGKPLQRINEVQSELLQNISDYPSGKSTGINVDEIDFTGLTKNVTEIVQHLGTKVHFSYDDRSINPVIQVRDEETGELIRQIPREEMLELLSKLKKLAGLIFQGKS